MCRARGRRYDRRWRRHSRRLFDVARLGVGRLFASRGRAGVQQTSDRIQELVRPERLHDHGIGTGPTCVVDAERGPLAAHQNDGRSRNGGVFLDRSAQINAAPIGEQIVDHDDSRMELGDCPAGFRGRRRRHDLVVRSLEGHLSNLVEGLTLVDP
jgi:hypothetical protein